MLQRVLDCTVILISIFLISACGSGGSGGGGGVSTSSDANDMGYNSICLKEVIKTIDVEKNDIASCEVLAGSLVISDLNDEEYIGLGNIKEIQGSLIIKNSGRAKRLHVFQQLEKIGGNLLIQDNWSLIEVDGFEKLEEIGGQLQVHWNAALINVGLGDLLQRVGGGVSIRGNDELTSSQFINGLKFVGGDLTVTSNAKLADYGDSLADAEIMGTIDISYNGLTIEEDELYVRDSFGVCSFGGIGNVLSYSELEKYAGCRFLQGDLNISGMDVNGLSVLAQLESISGDFELKEIEGIDTFENLSNLKYIGGNFSVTRTSLRSAVGLKNVEYIGGDISFTGNPNLKDLPNFSKITTVYGDLVIALNSRLDDLAGLETIENVWGDLRVGGRIGGDGQQLTSNLSLSNLKFVEGNVSLTDLSSLPDLEGLSSLTEVGGELSILRNPLINNLNGLRSLTKLAGELNISNNSNLMNLQGVGGLRAIHSLIVRGNPQLESLDGLDNLVGIIDTMVIVNNVSLQGYSELTNLNSVGRSLTLDLNEVMDPKSIVDLKGKLNINCSETECLLDSETSSLPIEASGFMHEYRPEGYGEFIYGASSVQDLDYKLYESIGSSTIELNSQDEEMFYENFTLPDFVQGEVNAFNYKDLIKRTISTIGYVERMAGMAGYSTGSSILSRNSIFELEYEFPFVLTPGVAQECIAGSSVAYHSLQKRTIGIGYAGMISKFEDCEAEFGYIDGVIKRIEGTEYGLSRYNDVVLNEYRIYLSDYEKESTFNGAIRMHQEDFVSSLNDHKVWSANISIVDHVNDQNVALKDFVRTGLKADSYKLNGTIYFSSIGSFEIEVDMASGTYTFSGKNSELVLDFKNYDFYELPVASLMDVNGAIHRFEFDEEFEDFIAAESVHFPNSHIEIRGHKSGFVNQSYVYSVHYSNSGVAAFYDFEWELQRMSQGCESSVEEPSSSYVIFSSECSGEFVLSVSGYSGGKAYKVEMPIVIEDLPPTVEFKDVPDSIDYSDSLEVFYELGNDLIGGTNVSAYGPPGTALNGSAVTWSRTHESEIVSFDSSVKANFGISIGDQRDEKFGFNLDILLPNHIAPIEVSADVSGGYNLNYGLRGAIDLNPDVPTSDIAFHTLEKWYLFNKATLEISDGEDFGFELDKQAVSYIDVTGDGVQDLVGLYTREKADAQQKGIIIFDFKNANVVEDFVFGAGREGVALDDTFSGIHYGDFFNSGEVVFLFAINRFFTDVDLNYTHFPGIYSYNPKSGELKNEYDFRYVPDSSAQLKLNGDVFQAFDLNGDGAFEFYARDSHGIYKFVIESGQIKLDVERTQRFDDSLYNYFWTQVDLPEASSSMLALIYRGGSFECSRTGEGARVFIYDESLNLVDDRSYDFMLGLGVSFAGTTGLLHGFVEDCPDYRPRKYVSFDFTNGQVLLESLAESRSMAPASMANFVDIDGNTRVVFGARSSVTVIGNGTHAN